MEEPKKISNSNEEIKEEVISKGRKILKISFGVCLVLFVFSGYRLVKYKLDANANRKILENISKSIEIDETVPEITYDNLDTFIGANSENEDTLGNRQEEVTVKSRYKINFDELKEQNLDAAGFLKVRGKDIEFVVVQTVDNDYYLRHNFEKDYNKAGWIFADYRNELDGSDRNIVVYGHNMLNGSMFSTLSNVLEKSWQEEINNRFITFITPSGTEIYEVFSVYQTEDSSYYTQTDFTESTFQEYIKTILSKSFYDFETVVNMNDQLLTLVTCGRSNSNRVIVHAKRLK